MVAILVAGATPVHAQLPPGGKWELPPVGMKFAGGGNDDLSVGDFVNSDGKHRLGFRPSPANISPVPPDLAKLVSGLIGAWQTGHGERYADYCTEFFHDMFALPFGPQDGLTPNTLYYLPKTSPTGPLVRVEWLRGSEVIYMTWFFFRDGKISAANTETGKVPAIYRTLAN
jgi:hypothetical protein